MENVESKELDAKSILETKKTALGINENIEGALCYILGFLTGILFLLLEKDNKFVRFHAMQSIIVSITAFIILSIFGIILLSIPFIGWVLYGLLRLAAFGIWLWLMFKAIQGEKYKLPAIGDFAEKQI